MKTFPLTYHVTMNKKAEKLGCKNVECVLKLANIQQQKTDTNELIPAVRRGAEGMGEQLLDAYEKTLKEVVLQASKTYNTPQ